MIIFENESDINLSDMYLNYRYGIRTELTIETSDTEASDAKTSDTGTSDTEAFNKEIISIFNQAIANCKTYSPFQMHSSNAGIFSEHTLNFRPVLEALFSHCVLSSLETAKYLTFTFYSNELTNVDSSLRSTDTQRYIFKHDLEKQLTHGYFYKSEHTNSNLPLIYDYDSPKWQSNRRTLGSLYSGEFMKKIIEGYKITFPSSLIKENADDKETRKKVDIISDKDSDQRILIPKYNADFISHLLLNPEILRTIKCINNHIKELPDDSSKKNANITNADTQEQDQDSSYTLTHSMEKTFQNHMRLINGQHISPNFVDSLIFADQLENTFHANLYLYLFNRQQQKYFENFLQKFSNKEGFNAKTLIKAYSEFIEKAIKSSNMSTSRLTPVFIDYAIRCLDNYSDNYDYPKYPYQLINAHSIAKFAPHTPVEQYHAFNVWLTQFDKYIQILSDLYLPILEKTFFLLLKNYFGTQSSFSEMMSKLYNFINTNNAFFNKENTAYQKLYESAPNESHKSFSYKYLSRQTPLEGHSDISQQYISLPESTLSFIKSTYKDKPVNSRNDLRLNYVSNLHYASDTLPKRPSNLDIFFLHHAGQLVEAFSTPFKLPDTSNASDT